MKFFLLLQIITIEIEKKELKTFLDNLKDAFHDEKRTAVEEWKEKNGL